MSICRCSFAPSAVSLPSRAVASRRPSLRTENCLAFFSAYRPRNKAAAPSQLAALSGDTNGARGARAEASAHPLDELGRVMDALGAQLRVLARRNSHRTVTPFAGSCGRAPTEKFH